MLNFSAMPAALQTVLLLMLANVFMTFAWYGHLKSLANSPWYTAALVSWGIALFEYMLQVPAKDRKSTRLNSSHIPLSRMPSSA